MIKYKKVSKIVPYNQVEGYFLSGEKYLTFPRELFEGRGGVS